MLFFTSGVIFRSVIRAVKAALRIPVIANGNVRVKADADACIAVTGVDAVMSATAILANPRLFSSARAAPSAVTYRDGPTEAEAMALEYLMCCREFPDGALARMMADHLLAILRNSLNDNPDLKMMLVAHMSQPISQRAHDPQAA